MKARLFVGKDRLLPLKCAISRLPSTSIETRSTLQATLNSNATVEGITAWTPDEFIAWVETYFTPPGTALVPTDQGNVQVR